MLLKWHVFEDAFGICLRIWSFGGDEVATSITAARPHLSNPPSAALATLVAITASRRGQVDSLTGGFLFRVST